MNKLIPTGLIALALGVAACARDEGRDIDVLGDAHAVVRAEEARAPIILPPTLVVVVPVSPDEGAATPVAVVGAPPVAFVGPPPDPVGRAATLVQSAEDL